MNKDYSELAAFHVTGHRSGDALGDLSKANLRPALLAPYGDLSTLRYDFPLILVGNAAAAGASVMPLSGLFNGILRDIAPEGEDGAQLRHQVLALETEIRTLVRAGASGRLRKLWTEAQDRLLSRAGKTAIEALNDNLCLARRALDLDGELIDCDSESAAKLLGHIWRLVEREKARKFGERITKLRFLLSRILKTGDMKSEASRAPAALEKAIGTSYQEDFDFEAMSRLLRDAKPAEPLPDKRRQRISAAFEVIDSQRFFARSRPNGRAPARGNCYRFFYQSRGGALKAYRDRLPAMIELIKAMSIAELEFDHRYDEDRHDTYFAGLDETSMAPADLALFPSYLVIEPTGTQGPGEQARLLEILSSDLPIKIVSQTDDLLGEPMGRSDGLRFANLAIGLNSAFVMQSTNSHLGRLKDKIDAGMRFDGPALFSIYTGAPANGTGIPAYLSAASAMQSRAFPAFTFDPSAGSRLAERFSIEGNPQADRNWPLDGVDYEDGDLQRVSETVAFTYIDFVAMDKRHAAHFAVVPRTEWHDRMVPANDYLEQPPNGAHDGIPYVLMIDPDNGLRRVIVDSTIIRAARRCGDRWRGLQELGGVNNSHAERLLERERKIWSEETARELAELKSQTIAEPAAAPVNGTEMAETRDAEPAPAPEEPSSGEPYIETPRCTTCEECIKINNRMFAYDGNKQAYIKDLEAGSFEDLVKSAENCQVCIIHPGQPDNRDEPNIDDLISRAEVFN